MKINDKLRQKRKELDINVTFISKALGITEDSYRDLERYEDEIELCLNINQVKKMSKILEIDLYDLFSIEITENEYENLTLCENLKAQRKKLKYTQNKLADKLGYEVVVIQELEKDSSYIENMNFAFVKDISKTLSIPLNVLLQI